MQRIHLIYYYKERKSLFSSESRLSSLEVNGSVSHAGGDTKGGCDSRQDADDDLNNGLPSFFVFHFLSG
jgi:hypothetical protein